MPFNIAKTHSGCSGCEGNGSGGGELGTLQPEVGHDVLGGEGGVTFTANPLPQTCW